MAPVEPNPVPPVPVEVVPYDPTWVGLFEAERAKVEGVLGHLVDGGVLERIEHMGSTSVPGLCAKPTIDMLGQIQPYPPGAAEIAALETIGYIWRGEYGLPGRTYFTKGPHEYHLHLVTFESDHWGRHLVFRDYLRTHADARDRYATLKLDLADRFHYDRPAYQDGKTELITILEREATEWYLGATGFTPVARLAAALSGLPEHVSWAVASGWALDLHLGEPSRFHDDVDAEVAATDQSEVQTALQAAGWRLDQVVADGTYAKWPPGEPLADGTHQVHARRDGEFLDLLFAPRDVGTWSYRRDPRVSLPLERALLRTVLPTGESVSYLAPEAVLVFKSRSHTSDAGETGPRPKDAADFARVLPTLDESARRWLAEALVLIHGDHPWLDSL